MDTERAKSLKSLSPLEVIEVLEGLVDGLGSRKSFPELTPSVKESLMRGVDYHLGEEGSDECHLACLSAVRVLSRDASNLPFLSSPPVIAVLLRYAGLDDPCAVEDVYSNINIKKLQEAQKCLSNLSLQSEEARKSFMDAKGFDSLCNRLKMLPKMSNYAVRTFDVRLFFLMTVHPDCRHLRKNSRKEYKALKSLLSALDNLRVDPPEGDSSLDWLGEPDTLLAIEILKAMYNMTTVIEGADLDEEDERECEWVGIVCRRLLLVKVFPDKEELVDGLRSHTVNLLSSLPVVGLAQLAPHLPLSRQPSSLAGDNLPAPDWEFMGDDMRAVVVLLQFLNHRLEMGTDQLDKQRISLTPVLALLCRLAASRRTARKYMRQMVLPPLANEVMKRPDEGNTLRNRLIKLMTAVTDVKDMAAQFLFELCKLNVERLIKYTGYGNAAGLLANYGLLAGRKAEGVEEMSEDEDSDTEEYLEAKPQVNPVLGCYEEERPSPMAGMSEEQKEYEAMKLVDQIDKMMKTGVLQPASVGEDGKPRPVEHILELRGHSPPPTAEEEEDD